MTNKDYNQTTGKWEHHFVHHGRDFRLSKRKQTAAAPWQIRIEHRGKQHWCSTGTNHTATARDRAKQKIDNILAGDQAAIDESKLRDFTKYATIGQVIKLYDLHSPLPRPTRRNNISSLRLILRGANSEKNVDTLSLEQLSADTIRRYQSAAIARVRSLKLKDVEDKLAMNRAQRSCNSIWAQARSIFADKQQAMMGVYKAAGLVFPSTFGAFLAAPMIRGVPQPRYVQPNDNLLARTIAAFHRARLQVEAYHANPPAKDARRAKQLARVIDRKEKMIVCAQLALGCGLRRKELMLARAGWIQRVSGIWAISLPEGATKNRQSRSLGIPAAYAQFLVDYVSRRKLDADDLLLSNGLRAAKQLSKWLRRLGWTGTKTNHALRKYFGYLVMLKHGMEVAQVCLDHKHISTTQQGYTGNIRTGLVTVEIPLAAPAPIAAQH